MTLSDLFKRFYSKVFIGLYARDTILHIGVVVLGRDGQLHMEQRHFSDGLEGEAFEYLQECTDRSPFNYIALLTTSAQCGAVPTCSVSKAKEQKPEIDGSKTVCIDDEWMNYCAEEAVVTLQEQFAAVQPDALYSPFALLHAFFETPMAGNHSVYLMMTPEAMSMAVVKERHLRFAEQFAHEEGALVPSMVERIVQTLETYYGKPCCRGEFIESVHIIDSAGVGEMLATMLEEVLLVEAEVQEVDAALLCAQTCMKENGYGL